MIRHLTRTAVALVAGLTTLVAVVTFSSGRLSARSSSEQIYVATFAPSSISGFHYDGGFVADDLDPRTPDTKLFASLDLSRQMVATDRYLMSANLFTNLGLAIVDRATGVELPRPRTTQSSLVAIAPSPDGRYAYLLGASATGQSTFSVIDLRQESATFDTEIKVLTLAANTTMVGMTADPTGTRAIVWETVTTPTPANSRLVTIDVTNPAAATVIKDAPATEPTFNVTPGFEAAGNGRLHTFSTGGNNYLIVPRRQVQIYKINADGSMTYVQSLALATPGSVRDAVFTTTGGANRIYAVATRTSTPFTNSVIAYNMASSGAGFLGTNLGSAPIDTQTAAEGATQIAASLDGSRLYLARIIAGGLPGTLVAIDAASVITSPAAAVIATQALTGITNSTAIGLAVVAPIASASQPTVTGVAVDGTANAVLINNATHTITVSGTNLANTHQAFIGLTRATVVSATATSVTITSPVLVPANTAPLVVLGSDGSAAGTVTIANAPDYFPSFVVYASSSGTNRVSVLNAATGTSVARQFDSGLGSADVAPTADGRFLIVANFRGNGVTIHSLSNDPAHGYTTDQIVGQPTFGATVQRIAVSPTRKRAYAAALGNDLVGIIDTDPDSPTFATTIGTFSTVAGGNVRALTISPDGNHLYINRINAPQLVIADISTDAVPAVTQITLGAPASASGRADGGAFSPDGTRFYFMNAGDTFLRIFDTTTPAAPVQISTIALPGAVAGDVHRIQVLPNNRFLYVASRAQAAVEVFDIALNSFVASVPSGAFSNDPAVSKNSNYVFLGVAETDTVLTIDARELVNGMPNPALHHIVASTGGGVAVSAVAVTGGIATDGGTNVTVQPQPGVTVTFADVTTPGLTTATSTNVSNVALPPYYFNGGLPVYVNIETSAVFDGGVTVCLAYSDAGLSAAQEGVVRLLHLVGGSYVDVTTGVNTAGNIACGAAGDLGQFVVALYDGDAPTVATAPNQTLSAIDATGAPTAFAAPTANDPLSGVASLSCDHASGATYPLGTTTITCTATDNVGRSGSASFTITVVDTTAPIVSVPAPITLTATNPAGIAATFSASATDNVDASVATSCSPASGSIFAIGTTTVSCAATDAAHNTGANIFTVTVLDGVAPVVSVPAGVTVTASNPGGATATFSTSATDNVDGSVAVTCVPASGSTFPIGNTTVTCSASDAAQNTGTNVFVVTVRDGVAPVVSVPANITLTAPTVAGVPASYSATATDNVDGVLAATCSPASGSTFLIGTNTVTCSATDAAHNTGSSSFTVTVLDGVPPVLSLPANFTMTAPGVGATVTYSATATDNVNGSVPTTCTPASGAHFNAGATTVNCSASDARGNTSTGSFVVTVVNNRPPVCTAAAPSVTSIWPANHSMVAVNILGVTDPDGTTATIKITSIFQDEPVNSGGDGNTNFDAAGINTSTAQVRAERSGQGNGRFYHINFTATDPAGASCSGEVKVVVPKSQGKNDTPVDGGALYNSTVAPPAIKED